MTGEFCEENGEAWQCPPRANCCQWCDYVLHPKIRHYSIDQSTNNWMPEQNRQDKGREIVNGGDARRDYKMKNDAE